MLSLFIKQTGHAQQVGAWGGQGSFLGHCWRLANLQYVPQAPREVDMVKHGEDGGKKENISRGVESGKSMRLTLPPNHAAHHRA